MQYSNMLLFLCNIVLHNNMLYHINFSSCRLILFTFFSLSPSVSPVLIPSVHIVQGYDSQTLERRPAVITSSLHCVHSFSRYSCVTPNRYQQCVQVVHAEPVRVGLWYGVAREREQIQKLGAGVKSDRQLMLYSLYCQHVCGTVYLERKQIQKLGAGVRSDRQFMLYSLYRQNVCGTAQLERKQIQKLGYRLLMSYSVYIAQYECGTALLNRRQTESCCRHKSDSCRYIGCLCFSKRENKLIHSWK